MVKNNELKFSGSTPWVIFNYCVYLFGLSFIVAATIAVVAFLTGWTTPSVTPNMEQITAHGKAVGLCLILTGVVGAFQTWRKNRV